MTDESRSPRTEAGKRLVETWGGDGGHANIDAILAIEAEAAAPRSGEPTCTYCGHTIAVHDADDCGAQDCQCQNAALAAHSDGIDSDGDFDDLYIAPRSGELDVERLSKAMVRVFGSGDNANLVVRQADAITAEYERLGK